METPGKKFTDLVEIENPQDTDLTLIRNETGVKKATLQKLSDYIKQKFVGWVFSDLITKDKTIPGAIKELNSALTTKVYAADSETNGFECWAVVDNHTVTFCIRGTAAVNLGTSENYALCGSFAQLKSLVTLNRSRIKRLEITPNIKGQMRFDIDTGYLRIGYTYNNNGTSVDIPKDTIFYLEETFVI